MIAIKKLSDESLSRITTFILAAVVCLFLTLPANTEAGIWDDSEGGNIDTVIKRVKNIKDNVDSLVKTIKDGKDTITDGKIKQMITDMKAMLQEAVNRQQEGVDDFMAGKDCQANDGTPCGLFRADLLFIFQSLQDLNNQLLSMHNIPSLQLEIEDPGLSDLLNRVPGRVLLPLYKVLTKTKFLSAGFLDSLENVRSQLEEIRPVLLSDSPIFPSSTSTSSLTTFSTTSSITTSGLAVVPTASSVCLLIERRPLLFSITSNALSGYGIFLKIVGALSQALGKTSLVGPKEVDAGIHGYVHGTLATDHVGSLGKILSGIGGVLTAISSSISSKITFCGIELRQIAILRGQKELLCAMKNNNLPACTEFVGNGFDNHGVGGGQGGGGKP
jgi:hypothetical protein